MSRIEQLISAYLEGRLAPDEAKELADLLACDRAALGDFIELYRQHRLLSAQFSSTSESDFAESVLADLRLGKDGVASSAAGAAASEGRRTMANKVASELKRSVRDSVRRQQNFWSRLFQTSLAGWSVAVAAVVVVMSIGFFWFRSAPLSAEITKSGAGVTVVRGSRNLAGYEGFQLRNGDLLQTSTNGTVLVNYLGEKTTLALRPGTQLLFQSSKHGKRLNLESGEIVVVAGHQPTNAPMIIATAQAQARVVGTRFQLAARRYSTWLQVAEGGVAFKRNVTGPAAAEEVVVRAGEYAVAADGLPLEKLPVTDESNVAHPLPIKIGWFNYYAVPNWYVHPPYVQQTQPGTITRTFQLPAVKGSILVAGAVTVNAARSGSPGGVGFGLGLSSGADYFLACVERKDGQAVLEIADLGKVPLIDGQPGFGVAEGEMVSLAEIPLPSSVLSGCEVKFALERENGRQAVVRAKAWSGASEPKEWQVAAPVKLHGMSDVFELRLMTENSACTFENTSAFLIE